MLNKTLLYFKLIYKFNNLGVSKPLLSNIKKGLSATFMGENATFMGTSATFMGESATFMGAKRDLYGLSATFMGNTFRDGLM